ncbi:MAG: copper resistance protein B [Gammaproteobacteria bacterium]|nr:copper resistance protein B [Gammaproteobacteria bacterium]
MFARYIVSAILMMAMLPSPVCADEAHGGGIFHAFQLEVGGGLIDDGSSVAEWDFEGWVGSDENKLWLKSEGERSDGETEQAEFWAMYSRNISEFWDIQIGIRHDTQPDSLAHAVVGFNGLAPYFLETEAHLFVSEDGDASVRIKQEMELLFTQRLIAEPYYEIDLYAQDVPELDIGAGLSAAELGIQTRYEITRDFAPYLEVKYERKLGETSSIAKSHGEDSGALIGTIGIKFLF